MATGVLPVCIGKATRLGQFLASSPKEYTGEIYLGLSTTTYDREGEPAGPELSFDGTAADIAEVMTRLTGDLMQVPPAYSAKKLGGEVSHKLARRGIAVENPPVPVRVDKFEITGFAPPRVDFRVVCSGGTYIRSLAYDLGNLLGCGAHLMSLRRIQSGDFSIERAVPLEQASAEDVLPMESLLTHLPLITVDEPLDEERVFHGNPVATREHTGLARIFNKKGEFLAVASLESGWAHPRVVLTSRTSVVSRERHGGQEP
jgi:tRNA pseudouridine55 synthase